ncbi:hypothetical protein KAK06_14365 [Ideonella sp. 4Y11]|uniref:Uncharacterized protein n=1 Tax=Ideonella aquatica TaxID=2824119 RepID=A0A941BRA3_9BURK|nr:hypothetical protein [Ideonella aquatica]MBQ0960135.1 hypothetical protein [Ideonella aquatica]
MKPPTDRVRRAGAVALGLAGAALAAVLHAAWLQHQAPSREARTRALVQALQLTDPAWFTEARATRHFSQADGHTAFQDGPGLPDHFPSAVWLPPPGAR